MGKLNEACTNAYLSAMTKLRVAKDKIKDRIDETRKNESGMEIIAVVLILAIVIAIVVIFRKNIAKLLSSLWEKIFGDSNAALDGGKNTPTPATIENPETFK